MENKTMGEIIYAHRHKLGLTQKDLADRLNITDKAVSKWERNVAFPDTGTIPKLAEILSVSVEELMGAKTVPITGHRGAGYFITLILKALPVAMGVAVVVCSLLESLDIKSLGIMLGIGVAAMGVSSFKHQN